MNHCLLEVTVKNAPTIRYTQDNKTPLAEMMVLFSGLKADAPQSELRVIGWGNLAQELQNNVQVGQKFVLEGRLRMNTVSRQDGTKEKRAEFTLSRLHSLIGDHSSAGGDRTTLTDKQTQEFNSASSNSNASNNPQSNDSPNWNSAPLIPDTDEIPF